MNIPIKGIGTMKRAIQTVTILTVIVVVIAGCSSQAKEQDPVTTVAVKTTHTVKVAEITKVQISEPLEQVANVIASAQVNIVAKAGADVLELKKARGEKVAAGDVIVALDDTDARLQHEQALLARESAEQSLVSGKKQWQNSVAKQEQVLSEVTRMYNKAKNDYDLGLVDKKELDQAENAYTNAKNDLALIKESSVSGLELQLKSAEVSLEMSDRALTNHDIQAPISGILTDLSVQEGMTINAGFGVGQIQQLDPIRIKAFLSAASAEKVRAKSQLQFYVPGSSEMYTGQISYLANVIDAQTGAYELNLSMANSDLALKPGMNVQVRLTDEEEQQVIAVPTLSIVREGMDSYVFVLVGNKVEKRKIELGRLNELNQEILSGVEAGEKLIVSGQHQLKDGDQVEVSK